MALEATLPKPWYNPTNVHSRARQSCYKARDAFYAYLEKELSKKPTESEIAYVGLLYPVECKKSRDEFLLSNADLLGQYCAKKRVQGLLDDNE